MQNRFLVGIDDTDELDWDVGTGKLARRLSDDLADAFDIAPAGVVRQQFLVDDRVPYTTHNSGACLRFDASDGLVAEVVAHVGDYLTENCAPNADPGLCVAYRDDVPASIAEWGHRASEEVLDAADARALAADHDIFLDDYGGTGDGVVGALAAVGRTAEGDTGRFVEYGRLRDYGDTVTVPTLLADGIRVVNGDGEPVETGAVATHGWLRPQLRAGEPTLPVERDGDAYRPANLDQRGSHP